MLMDLIHRVRSIRNRGQKASRSTKLVVDLFIYINHYSNLRGSNPMLLWNGWTSQNSVPIMIMQTVRVGI